MSLNGVVGFGALFSYFILIFSLFVNFLQIFSYTLPIFSFCLTKAAEQTALKS